LGELRIADFSSNALRHIPDSFFASNNMVKLDLSKNQLVKVPSTALSNMAAMSLYELNLSHNNIGTIHNMDLSNKFRVKLLF
jgi:Leucine-rich repeat (LRR) protein